MNEIMTFNFQGSEVRNLMINDEPWWVGKDVATVLGYKDTVNALKSHVGTEDKQGWQITTPTRDQTVTVINESGLYSLILRSKLESAKAFKRWVTSEVLPQIRKTGSYGHAIDTKDSIRLLKEIRPMAKLKPQMYVDAVQEILRKTGIDIHTSKKPHSITVDNSIDEFVRGCRTLDGHSSSEVYNDYLAYCVKHDVHTVSHIQFTKHLKQHHGIEVIFKKINGKTVRMYSKT